MDSCNPLRGPETDRLPASRLHVLLWAASKVLLGAVLYAFLGDPITDGIDEFLVSGLQATAAIVGLIFGISIIAIEHSTGNYSSIILKLFREDKFVWFVAAYGLSTIIFTGFVTFYSLPLEFVCFVMFTWNMLLLLIYLNYVLNFMNPAFIMNRIKTRALGIIRDGSKDMAGRAAGGDSIPLGKDRLMSLVGSMLGDLQQYDRALEYIILHDYEKSEHNSTEKALDTYFEVAEGYLSSFSGHPFAVYEFFDMILEKIREYSDNALDGNYNTFLAQIICMHRRVGVMLAGYGDGSTAAVTARPLQNLVAELDSLCRKCMEKGNSRPELEIIVTLGVIGVASMEKNGQDNQATSRLLGLGKYALRRRSVAGSFACAKEAFDTLQKGALHARIRELGGHFEGLAELLRDSYGVAQDTDVQDPHMFEMFRNHLEQSTARTFRDLKESIELEEDAVRKAVLTGRLDDYVELMAGFGRKIPSPVGDAILKSLGLPGGADGKPAG